MTFDDVLLKPQLGVLRHRAEADLTSWVIPSEPLRYPFIAAPMPAIASRMFLTEACRLGMTAVSHRFQEEREQLGDAKLETRAWHAIGLDHSRFAYLFEGGVRKFCLDVAHAHSLAVKDFFDTIPYTEGCEFMVGNVATAEAARWLLDTTPTNSIKVGIGPGSVCTTREVTGHGVPQLTAIQEIAQEVDNEVTIIADGGIRNSGDIVKALAAGAHMVMLGRLFANALECKNDGIYYGCASERQNGHRAPEGVSVTITQAREPLEDIVKRLAWGLRSGISYSGATDILSLQDNAVFIPASGATQIEGRTR